MLEGKTRIPPVDVETLPDDLRETLEEQRKLYGAPIYPYLFYARNAAYFRAAGINNGLTASELGLSYLLPRAIGSSRAFEIMLTGRDIDAEEAERIGLVSRQVPDDQLLETCYDMAERIAAFSRPGVELTKRTLWSGLDAASLEGHMQAEGLGQLFVRLLTGNFEEAVAARAEKRPPVFTDDK